MHPFFKVLAPATINIGSVFRGDIGYNRGIAGRPLQTAKIRHLRVVESRMAINKSAIYRSLWDSCDQLRSGMDASLYKDYILTMLFLKYVSDRAGSPGSLVDATVRLLLPS